MRRQQSSSIVFLTELFMALTIFALCSSVCAGLFMWSHRYSNDSKALSKAVIAAQGGAEAFKRNAAAGDLAKVLGGAEEDGGCIVYYDKEWLTTGKNEAIFIMRIRLDRETSLRYAEIVVTDANDAGIFTLKASALAEEGRL
ncbi:MAG: hypothetical protein LBH09_01845 [Peptococcaceae bacterium]|jgi:hypothetical protein|nr:hypothetical protein [Peptococcaceae bacterium]